MYMKLLGITIMDFNIIGQLPVRYCVMCVCQMLEKK